MVRFVFGLLTLLLNLWLQLFILYNVNHYIVLLGIQSFFLHKDQTFCIILLVEAVDLWRLEGLFIPTCGMRISDRFSGGFQLNFWATNLKALK